MRVTIDSYWDDPVHWEYEGMADFAYDVELLDKAHKRAKKELRKQQKALAKKNDIIEKYRNFNDELISRNIRLVHELSSRSKNEEKAMVLLTNMHHKMTDTNLELMNNVTNVELKLSCVEQENKTLRQQQTNGEKEVQERIIQSMNDTIVELRAQLNETEEKYNELLKHVINEK